jgi:uncharacterized membrane protein (UPF0182 family)
MSPVNRFDEEGLPVLYIKDIPPASSVGLTLDRPLYFGEETPTYIVVRGGTTEFDYGRGQENVDTTYQGRDGVSLGTRWRRALFAWYFGDIKLLISENVTAGSRILFRRLIQERISRVAPFLRLDRDSYRVVADGRLLWLQDAPPDEVQQLLAPRTQRLRRRRRRTRSSTAGEPRGTTQALAWSIYRAIDSSSSLRPFCAGVDGREHWFKPPVSCR